MNIVFLRSNPINPDPRVEKEVHSLARAGHKVSILCWDRSGQMPGAGEICIYGIAIPIVRWSKKSAFGSGLKNLWKILAFQIFLLRTLFARKNMFDTIHAADFDTALSGLIVKIFFKKRLVYDIYDFYVDAFPVPRLLKPFLRYVDFLIINSADAVILPSENRRNQISGSRPRRLLIIHNTPLYTVMSEHLASESIGSELVLAYVGVLQPDRLLLEAIQVVSRHPTWKLVIAGFGLLEDEITSYSTRYRNIVFLGPIDYARSLEVNAAADVLFATYDPVVPNHRYSAPNKLYEAMMLSKPIIVCNNTSADEIVRQEGVGLTIDYTAEAFETAVEQLSSNSTIRSEMGRRSRQLYEQQYSWSLMDNRLAALYEEL